jgi:hypothetical protein
MRVGPASDVPGLSAATCAAMPIATPLKAISQFSSAASMACTHHVSEAHLKRYLAEFDFRHNNRMSLGVTDGERTENALRGIEGKRLTYR